MRYFTYTFVLFIAASITSVAAAQDSADERPTAASPTTTAPMSLGSLTAKVERLEDQVAEFRSYMQTALSTKIELESEISALKIRVEDLTNSLKEVVTKDPTTQQNISNVLGNMQTSDAFQKDLRSATQGRLVIKNFTGAPRLLYINGSLWEVRTNESFVWVPLGVVSIQRTPNATPSFVTDWEFKKNEDPNTRGKVPYYSEATYSLNLEQ